MKDLLYLKDEQIKDFIQLLFYAYRETFADPKEILSKKFFGPAHLRSLNLIERHPGISLGELMFKLKVTKQSLNRVLKDLKKETFDEFSIEIETIISYGVKYNKIVDLINEDKTISILVLGAAPEGKGSNDLINKFSR